MSVRVIEGELFRFHVDGSEGNVYLVDLEANYVGWCSCQDYEFRCQPPLNKIRKMPDQPDNFRCKHILQAREFAAPIMLDALITMRRNLLTKLRGRSFLSQ